MALGRPASAQKVGKISSERAWLGQKLRIGPVDSSIHKLHILRIRVRVRRKRQRLPSSVLSRLIISNVDCDRWLPRLSSIKRDGT